jgi:cytochrome c553
MKRYLFLIVVLLLAGCGKKEEQAPIPETPGKITVITGDPVVDQERESFLRFLAYDIRGEQIVRYAPSGEETEESKNVAPYVVVRNTPYASIHNSLKMKRLSKNFIVLCSACHDNYANGVIGPTLLGMSGDEVYDMIVKYRTDQVKNVAMRELVRKMDDKEIRFIAEDIAKFNEEIRKEMKK